MKDDESTLQITRRTFLASSAATVVTPALASTSIDPAEFTDLRLNVARANGAITRLEIILSAPVSPHMNTEDTTAPAPLKIALVPESFGVALSEQGDNGSNVILEVTGIPNRAGVFEIDHRTKLTIIARGAEAFRHNQGNTFKGSRDIAYSFDLSFKNLNGESKGGHWCASFQTNIWRTTNAGQDYAIKFFEIGGYTSRTTPLTQFIKPGPASFHLVLGNKRTTGTLERITGLPFLLGTENDKVSAKFSWKTDDSPSVDGVIAPALATWTLEPLSIGGTKRFSTFANLFSFERVSFHWQKITAEQPQFLFTIDGANINGGTYRSIQNEGTEFSLISEDPESTSVIFRCETVEKTFEDKRLPQRQTRVVLSGDFTARVGTTNETYATVDLLPTQITDNSADTTGIPEDARRIELVPDQGSATNHVLIIDAPTALRVHENAGDTGAAADDLARLPGFMPSKAPIPTARFGAADAASEAKRPTRLRAIVSDSSGSKTLSNFVWRADLSRLPIWLEDADHQGLLGLVASDKSPRRPLFILEGLDTPGVSAFEQSYHGVISLDGPTLNVPLDGSVLSTRRARDFLVLDFRFANLRTQWNDANERFEILRTVDLPEEAETPFDTPREAVLVAEFPPQHVAEQAYLRLRNRAINPPDPDWAEILKFLREKTADTSSIQDPTPLFSKLKVGSRSDKRSTREQIKNLAAEWITQFANLPELGDEEKVVADRLADSLNKMLDFSSRFPAPQTQKLPQDQSVYIGLTDCDPDAAKIAWDMVGTSETAQLTAAFKERLSRIEGWPKFGDNASYRPDPKAKDALITIARALFGKEPDQLDYEQARDVQAEMTGLKEQLGVDYAAFRTLWREELLHPRNALRQQLDDDGFDEVREFISSRWAEQHPLNIVRAQYSAMLTKFTDPTGQSRDPYEVISRARFSGRSRLAFRWDWTPEEAGVERAPLSLARLLLWNRMDQAVTRRARVLREPVMEDGSLRRIADDQAELRYQGIRSKPGKTSGEHMAEVYSAAAVAPTSFETAIEMPFRLQLSTAQDATLRLPHPLSHDYQIQKAKEEDRELAEDETTPAVYPIFNVSLSKHFENPLLRAVWSNDFRPETLIGETALLDEAHYTRLNGEITTDLKTKFRLFNAVYNPPPRGALAPWNLPQVLRRDGEIELVQPEVGPDGLAPRFRASMDAYDRDQIVWQSSVPGLPVAVGRKDKTFEIRKDASAFDPPENYQLHDLETTEITLEDGSVIRRDLSGIYRPKPLDFSELRLMAPGGTINLDTSFEPPVSPRRVDAKSLYQARSLERWRHRAIVGRDAKVELVYRGYLFPFGNRAALIKVTDRVYDEIVPGRGPTAVPVQRFFISVSQPIKTRWYGQPDEGRGWPCDRLELLTTETPDLVDPLEGAPNIEGGDQNAVRENPNGRLSLGPNGRGLVFWPRTSPSEVANFRFEFLIDGRGRKISMPLIFVDNVAANEPESIATLVDYYNDRDIGLAFNDDYIAPELDPASPRVALHYGTKRRYGPEVSEGDCTYETLGWAIGAEGRAGGNGFGLSGKLRDERKKYLGQRENYIFGPLLRSDDQPPFYPFMQVATIRLDRLARLVGERRGQVALSAHDADFIVNGLKDPDETIGGNDGVKALMGVLSSVDMDVKNKGDRVGAIGRPSGRVRILARREGPVTVKRTETGWVKPDHLYRPPAFGQKLKTNVEARPQKSATLDLPSNHPPAFLQKLKTNMEAQPLKIAALNFPNNYLPDFFKNLKSNVDNRSLRTAALALPENQITGTDALTQILDRILGDSNAKFLGVFKLTEIIKFALMSLEDNVPQVRETLDFASGAIDDAVAFARSLLVPLEEALEELQRAFEEAALDIGSKSLEIARVYPDLGSAIARLRSAINRLRITEDQSAAVALLPELPAAGKALMKAIDKVASDPVSPLKLELQRLFASELAEFEKIQEQFRSLVELLGNLKQLADKAICIAYEELSQIVAEVLPEIQATVREMAPLGLPEGEIYDDLNTEIIVTADSFIATSITSIIPTANADGVCRIEDLPKAIQSWAPQDHIDQALRRDGNGNLLLLIELEKLGKDLADPLWRAIKAELQNYQDLKKAIEDLVQDLETAREALKAEKAKAENDATEVVARLERQADALKRTEQALRDQLPEILRRLANSFFGIDVDRAIADANQIVEAVEAIGGASEPLEQLEHTLAALRLVDKMFLQGTYTNRVNAAIAETASVALDPAKKIAITILDVYETALLHTRSIAFATRPVTGGVTDTFLTDVHSAVVEIEAVAGEVAEAKSDFEQKLSDAIARLDGTTRNVTAEDGHAAFVPICDCAANVLMAQSAFAAEAKKIGEGEQQPVLTELGQTTLNALRQTANSFARGIVVYDAFDAKANSAEAAINTARTAIQSATTPQQIQSILQDTLNGIPRAEIMALLDVWPQIGSDVARQLKRVLDAFGLLDEALQGELESAIKAQKQDLAKALTKLQADLLTAAQKVIDDVLAQIETELKDLAQAVTDSLAGPTQGTQQSLLQYRSAFLRNMREVREALDAAAAQYPPVALLHGHLRAALNRLEDQPLFDALDNARTDLKSKAKAFEDAVNEYAAAAHDQDKLKKVSEKRAELLKSKNTLLETFQRTLHGVSEATSVEARQLGDNLREAAAAESIRMIAAVQHAAGEAAESALAWAASAVFPGNTIGDLERALTALQDERNEILQSFLTNTLAERIEKITKYLGLGAKGDGIVPAHLLIALQNTPEDPVKEADQKKKLLVASAENPQDLLHQEAVWTTLLNAPDAAGAKKLAALRQIFNHFEKGGQPSGAIIVRTFVETVQEILRADISRIVSFDHVRDLVEREVRKLIPTRATTTMDFKLPVQSFKGIFEPVGNGVFTLSSRTTVDLAEIDLGNLKPPRITAAANAVMSPFSIKLLGSFDAITLHFSAARMGWTSGSNPTFDLDFLNYEIGPQLEFVQQLAESLTASSGGAFIRPARAMLGIEAGYGINIPGINLGGVTFMNVGLNAYARLPFEPKKAEFGASLSSRHSPFIIIAGIWGGGGHFGLVSDGRRIVSFDASFNVNGGGAVAYGPLTLQGRVSVGIFIRKAGSVTEISGDFFVGGSGKIGIFGVSASLMVTMGMDRAGDMTGSAVFTFSFSISFAKVKFSVILFKKEGKGFNGTGAEQSAALWQGGPVRFASTSNDMKDFLNQHWPEIAEVKVDTKRADQDYKEWTSYFTDLRPVGY